LSWIELLDPSALEVDGVCQDDDKEVVRAGGRLNSRAIVELVKVVIQPIKTADKLPINLFI
jgi:hypothetical protein